MLFFTPIFFMISGMVVMRSRYDLDGYCSDIRKGYLSGETNEILLQASKYEDKPSSDSLFSDTNHESFMNEDGEIDLQLLFMHTIAQTSYFSKWQALGSFTPECHLYSDDEIFQYNFYVWGLGFFLIGLQSTHQDVGPFRRFIL